MRPLTCLDRDREHKRPAPRGSVRSESTAERLARILREASELPDDSPEAIRWRAHWDGLNRRRY